MAEKATVNYQVKRDGVQLVVKEEVEAEDKVKIHAYGPEDDLIHIEGDIKSLYVHRGNLVSVIVDKASDIE